MLIVRLSVVYMYVIICLLSTEAIFSFVSLQRSAQNLSQDTNELLSWKVGDWRFNGGYLLLWKKTQFSLHKVFVWRCSTFIGHKAKHSSYWRKTVCPISQYFNRSRSCTLMSPGRKNHAFEMVPFLESKNVPHLLYWGCNKTDMR